MTGDTATIITTDRDRRPTGDLLIITPSRGRPVNVARLLATVHAQRRLETHVHVAVDADDPALEDYQRVFAQQAGEGDGLVTGPRKGLTGWTNEIAVKQAAHYRCLASFGDDHVPRTKGFDKALVRACTEDGPGIAYPWDGTREDVPEAPVVDSRIVAALGWFLNPACAHWYVDDTLAALGRGAGCLHHLRAIAVDHVRGEADATAADNMTALAADKAAYGEWRQQQMQADIATIVTLRGNVLQPA
jgi:hypothetical protein